MKNKYLKHLDFEDILRRLPDRFQDTDLHSIVPATQEMADEIAPDIAGMYGADPMEVANIFHSGDIVKIMMDLKLIEPDFSVSSVHFELWYKKL